MTERLDDQGHGDKVDAWILYCAIYHEFYPNNVVQLSPAILAEMAERLRTRSAGTRIAPPHLTEMFCLNLAVCVEGGIEVSQAARDGLLKKLTDLREWCKTPHSATEAIVAPSAQYDPMAHFDKCDGGLPCMATTTGCAKGQCSRRRPHAFMSTTPCAMCGKPADGHPHVFVIGGPQEAR